LTDAVEKVGGILTVRKKRIMQAGKLNRSCAFDARLENLASTTPSKPFSTASTLSGPEAFLGCSVACIWPSFSQRIAPVARPGCVPSLSVSPGSPNRNKKRQRRESHQKFVAAADCQLMASRAALG
jgi:hypothetical protein